MLPYIVNNYVQCAPIWHDEAVVFNIDIFSKKQTYISL